MTLTSSISPRPEAPSFRLYSITHHFRSLLSTKGETVVAARPDGSYTALGQHYLALLLPETRGRPSQSRSVEDLQVPVSEGISRKSWPSSKMYQPGGSPTPFPNPPMICCVFPRRYCRFRLASTRSNLFIICPPTTESAMPLDHTNCDCLHLMWPGSRMSSTCQQTCYIVHWSLHIVDPVPLVAI